MGYALQNEELERIKGILEKDACILAAFLFGSQADGRPHKYSDVDIAVLFDDTVSQEKYTDRQISLITGLSEILKREVDIVILSRASLFLRYHILKHGIKVYERPGRNEHSFEAAAIIQYLDFVPIKNRIENSMLAKIKGV